MGAPDILSVLESMGLTLAADGDRLRVESPSGITEEARELIRAHKPDLLRLIATKDDPFPALPAELDALIIKVGKFHNFAPDQLRGAREVAAGDVENALVSFRLLAAEVDAPVDVDRDAFEERAAIRQYDGGYSRPEAELLAAWEVTQALFARLTAREWLARYAPERLPAGDKPENYPAASLRPGNDFWVERKRRGGGR